MAAGAAVRLVLVALALLAAREAYAQPVPTTCTALCPDGRWVPTLCAGNDDPCGGAGQGDSGERAREAEAQRYAIELDAAVRAGTDEQQRAFRRANDRGIAAFQHHDWDLAVQSFEGAQRLDPANALVAANLREARDAQAAERARRASAAAPHPASDLRLPPPPPPLAPPPPPVAVTRALEVTREAWARTVPVFDISAQLAPARQAYRDAAPLLPDFLRTATFDAMTATVGHGANTMYHWVESIAAFRELGGGYRHVAEGLVDRVVTEIYTGVDQTDAGANDVTQFAAEEAHKSLWGAVKQWGSHTAANGPSR